MAAGIRKRLGLEVEKQHGAYGEFIIRVDGAVVVDGGAMTFLGILPGVDEVVESVRARLKP